MGYTKKERGKMAIYGGIFLTIAGLLIANILIGIIGILVWIWGDWMTGAI